MFLWGWVARRVRRVLESTSISEIQSVVQDRSVAGRWIQCVLCGVDCRWHSQRAIWASLMNPCQLKTLTCSADLVEITLLTDILRFTTRKFQMSTCFSFDIISSHFLVIIQHQMWLISDHFTTRHVFWCRVHDYWCCCFFSFSVCIIICPIAITV